MRIFKNYSLAVKLRESICKHHIVSVKKKRKHKSNFDDKSSSKKRNHFVQIQKIEMILICCSNGDIHIWSKVRYTIYQDKNSHTAWYKCQIDNLAEQYWVVLPELLYYPNSFILRIWKKLTIFWLLANPRGGLYN